MSTSETMRPKKANNNLPLLLLLLVTLLVGASPYLLWLVQPQREIPGVIFDKTVPDHTYREHNGLTWALNYFKIKPPAGDAWRKQIDYVGFYPADSAVFSVKQPGQGRRLTPDDLKGQQWLYVTDTYGVYQQDIENAAAYEKRQALQDSPFQNVETANPLQSPNYSAHIYGGIQAKEIDALEAFSQRGGHVIAEFNTFASPTQAAERKRLENFFGVHWTGWTGRFFQQLENPEEVPAWARENYKRQYGKAWSFSGKGWVVVHEDGRIGVLSASDTVKNAPRDALPQALNIHVTQPQHALLNGVYDRVPYTYWFDILEPLPGSQVLAEYAWRLTPSGKKTLQNLGLPERFPFMVLAAEAPLRLYVAGDASDRAQTSQVYKLKGRLTWERFGRFKEPKADQDAFFWSFYLPWIQNVLDHVATRPCVEC